MKQYYDFKIENIKNLTQEEISVRKKSRSFLSNWFSNKKDED